MHLMIRPIMPYDIPKLTENPFVLISGFVLVITAVLIAVVLSRYAAEVYKGNRKKSDAFLCRYYGICNPYAVLLFWMCCNCGQGMYLLPTPPILLL